MNKITVIGSLNADMVICTPRVPKMGETLSGSGFGIFPGGKGANQAVAAARLGGDVSMVGCVGSDAPGQSLVENLKCNNVDTKYVKILDNISTGVAVIVIKDGDNFIILDAGANGQITTAQVEGAEELIAASDILMLQLEIPLPVVERAVEIARKHNVKVLLNPAPACILPDTLLRNIDIITPNESECELLTGNKITSADDAVEATRKLLEKGVKRVVVTLGDKGAVYIDKEMVLHKGVPKVDVVDTTAAGDSFSGALAVALASGKPIDKAMDFANRTAGITVTRKGAQTSLPHLHEVEEK